MPQSFLKNLRIIHLALFMGCLLFLIVSYFINSTAIVFDTSFSNPLSIVGVVLLVFVFLSSFIYLQRLKGITDTDTLELKKQKYTSAFIILMALLEGPALFNIVIFQITSNGIHLIIAGIFLLNMLTKMPNKIHISSITNIPIDEL